MNGLPRDYRLNPNEKYVIVFSIVWMLLCGGMGLSVFRWGGPPEWVDAGTKFLHLGIVTFLFVIGGLGIVGIINGIRALNDTGPKLTLTPEELIDHRAKEGVTRIRWADVASVDCELWGHYSGKLVVYVRDLFGVTTRQIDIGGLDQTPSDIFVEIKKMLLITLPEIPPAKNIAVLYDLDSTDIQAGQPDIPRSRTESTEKWPG